MLHKLACCLALLSGISLPAWGQTITQYSYDALGRLTRVDRPTSAVIYAYDAAGNRSSVSSVNPYATYWEAEALWHNTGYADADGWAANTGNISHHMVFGPWTSAVPAGSRTAAFRLMIGSLAGGAADSIAVIDIYDATAGQILASDTLQRQRWVSQLTYQTFELPFTMDVSRSGHLIEFRVYYIGGAYIRADKLGFR